MSHVLTADDVPDLERADSEFERQRSLPRPMVPAELRLGVSAHWLVRRFVCGVRGWPDDERFQSATPASQTHPHFTRPDLTTYDACQQVCKADTKQHSCSYVKWLMTEGADDKERLKVIGEHSLPVVGIATHFVSHSWKYPFQFLVLVLRQWVPLLLSRPQKPKTLYSHVRFTQIHEHCTPEETNKGIYFWIDIFSVDQHKASAGTLPPWFWEACSP